MTQVINTSVFSPNAQKILCRRYFLKGDQYPVCDRCDKQHESEDEFLNRVSFGVPEYREVIESLDFLPNSPTLFNAGTEAGCLSACFVLTIDDNMESIMDVAKESALIQKWGGGVGYSFSEIRAKGTPIKSTHGQACGPVAVLKTLNAVSTMITQAGKRDAAQMGVLRVDHPDVREFIHCKDVDPDAISNFNISLAITDDFMKRVQQGDADAVDLFNEIAESAWKSGDPGVLFIDAAERSNPIPHVGRYEATNPCSEQWLLNHESCNLGSINLAHFVLIRPDANATFDYTHLERVVRTTVRYLDHVVTVNKFPFEALRIANLMSRRIGLGIMGWADALALMSIHYDSEQGVALAAEVMKFIQLIADEESLVLGETLGTYEAYVDGPAYRNAARLTIAPTGTISILANCSSGCEPHYSLHNTRVVGADVSGASIVMEQHASVLELTDFVPHTANQISPEWHVRMQAAFQRYVDNSISKTINMPNSATVEDIREAYFEAWLTGCKGIAVFRDGCRDKQVLREIPAATSEVVEQIVNEFISFEQPTTVSARRRRLPDERLAVNHKFEVGDVTGYISVGLFDDGAPGELFITMSKEGSTTRGLMDALGILTSLGLQYGVPLEQICNKLQNVSFEPSGFTSNPLIPKATSPVDYIFHWMLHKFQPSTMSDGHHNYVSNGHTNGVATIQLTNVDHGMLCPECGSQLIMQEGCMNCSNYNCGWSKC